MAKIKRNTPAGRFTVTNAGDGTATIRSEDTGAVRTLKGYGSLKGEYVVRKGIDITRPIAAQAAKAEARKTAMSAARVPRKKVR